MRHPSIHVLQRASDSNVRVGDAGLDAEAAAIEEHRTVALVASVGLGLGGAYAIWKGHPFLGAGVLVPAWAVYAARDTMLMN